MLQRLIFCGVVLSASLAAMNAYSQAAAPYSLSISVDEIDLTFHAMDAHGSPVHDLKLEEMSILDNGRRPDRILSFGSLRDLPVRAGILMDTSESMAGYLARNRAIAIEYAELLLRPQSTDEAFVMDFDTRSAVVQPWTADIRTVRGGIRGFTPSSRQRHGTAIVDSMYRACLNQFGRLDRKDTANFILLFSDGEDNASLASAKDAIDMCQRTNTAVYIFRAESEAGDSTGATVLAELASKSGGRVFYDDDSDTAIHRDLQTIDSDLRNLYRVIYKPAELKHDGSFHRIELKGPERVETMIVRSGYYAPVH